MPGVVSRVMAIESSAPPDMQEMLIFIGFLHYPSFRRCREDSVAIAFKRRGAAQACAGTICDGPPIRSARWSVAKSLSALTFVVSLRDISLRHVLCRFERHAAPLSMG